MSRYTTSVYAKALVAAIQDGKHKNVASNFLLLCRRHRLSPNQADKIIFEAERTLLGVAGSRHLVFETARPMDVSRYFKKIIKKGDRVEQKVNPGLVAGVRVVINGEEQLDFSFAKTVDDMFHEPRNY